MDAAWPNNVSPIAPDIDLDPSFPRVNPRPVLDQAAGMAIEPMFPFRGTGGHPRGWQMFIGPGNRVRGIAVNRDNFRDRPGHDADVVVRGTTEPAIKLVACWTTRLELFPLNRGHLVTGSDGHKRESAVPEILDMMGDHDRAPGPASPTLASSRDAIHDSTSASRQATQPGEIRTGSGNCPRRRCRQIVVADSPTRAATTGSRSNLDERKDSDGDGEVGVGSDMAELLRTNEFLTSRPAASPSHLPEAGDDRNLDQTMGV